MKKQSCVLVGTKIIGKFWSVSLDNELDNISLLSGECDL